MSKKDIALSSQAVKSVAIDGDRQLRIIATAPTLDRDLEVIDTNTIKVPVKPRGLKYASELTPTDEIAIPFLIDHDWSIEKQAGYVKSMEINAGGELEAVVQLANVDNGDRVYQLAKDGALNNSFSIGFTLQNATDEDGVIKNIELLEISAVFKGSNRDARLLEVKSVKEEKSMSKLDELKAEVEAKNAEITELEKVDVKETEAETEPVTIETTDEVVEEVAEVEETKDDETKVVETTAEVKTVEQETKSIKKESEMTEVETKSIVEAPVVEQVVETKAFDKVDHAAKQFVAYLNKDTKALAKLNKEAMETYAGSKATYLNAGTSADGGAIVPSAQLLADVYSVLSTYSGVANDIRVITLTSGDSLDIASLIDDVIVSEVNSEGDSKSVTKPDFGETNVQLREFAGIAILTKKLVRQAAVNVYDILRDSFARAIARKRAELILTDATSGIVNKAGVTVVTSAGSLPTWKELQKAPFSIPVAAVAGSKYYLSRALVASLAAQEDTTNRPLNIVTLDGPAGLSGRLANGFQFVVEEELGGTNPDAVFGSFGRFGVLLRQGAVESETFDTGIVTDGASVEHNLLQQNKLAQRVAFYENVGFPVPSAFAVVMNGSSS